MKRLILVLALIGAACASAPVNVTPEAQVAFKKHEVQKDLDLIRDIAVDANAQSIISESDTRLVVVWHESALTIIHDTTNWQTGLRASLEQLQKDLSPQGQSQVKPYIALALAIVKGIQ